MESLKSLSNDCMTQQELLGKTVGSLIWSLKIFRGLQKQVSQIVKESIEDVEENQTERGIVRTSERNEQIGDDSDETINNVAAETLVEKTQLIIAQLNKILAGGRNTDGISFK